MKMCSLRLCVEFLMLVAGFWENRCVTKTKIDNIVDKLGYTYININSAKKTFGTKEFSSRIRKKNNENVKKSVNKPWFNEECKNKQRLFRKLNRIKHRSTFHRDSAKEAEKEYKKKLNKAHAKYRQDLQDKMQKELARIHGKSAHLAKCSQLFKKSFKANILYH